MSNKNSFTIIEVIIATFILTTGTLGIFSVIQMILTFTSNVSSQLAAVYLTQEGIENIRNIRDSNWLKQRSVPDTTWDDGILSADWQTIGKFQRRTTITKPQSDRMVVSVEVKWSDRSTGQVAAETELYDWR